MLPFAAVDARAETEPVCGSQSSAVAPAARSVTAWVIACGPSLKKRYTPASLSRRVVTFKAASDVSSETSRAPVTALTAYSIAAGTCIGSGGAAGGCGGQGHPDAG